MIKRFNNNNNNNNNNNYNNVFNYLIITTEDSNYVYTQDAISHVHVHIILVFSFGTFSTILCLVTYLQQTEKNEKWMIVLSTHKSCYENELFPPVLSICVNYGLKMTPGKAIPPFPPRVSGVVVLAKGSGSLPLGNTG